MDSRITRFQLPLFLVFLTGAAFAFWLNFFFANESTTYSPELKADLLAAENYRSAAFSAPLPPSPAHWAQRLTGLTADGGERYVVARDANALLLALTGSAAGVLAFGAAAAALALAGRAAGQGLNRRVLLVTCLILLATTHTWGWRLEDPFPFVVLAASSVFYAAWMRWRDTEDPTPNWSYWISVSVLSLCAWELALLALLVSAPDHFGRHQKSTNLNTNSAPKVRRASLGKGALILTLLLVFLGTRNLVLFENPLTHPSGVYREANVTAPQWFWQRIGEPPPKGDFVIERYDELVAIAETRRPTPVYRDWFLSISEGVSASGGWALLLAAGVVVLGLPPSNRRPLFRLLGGLAVLEIARYGMPTSWWAFLAPALAGTLATASTTQTPTDRLPTKPQFWWALAIVSFCTLPFAPQFRPHHAQTVFENQRKEAETKIRQIPGKHLVFVSLNPSVDASVEPSFLPRSWTEETILFARDLSPAQNARLVAELSDRTPWRLQVFPDHMAVQSWPPPATAGDAEGKGQSSTSATPGGAADSVR